MSVKKASFSVRPFDKLRKAIDQRDAAAAPPPIRRKKKEQFTDEELFSTEMNDVAEIEAFRALACEQHPRKSVRERVRRDPEEAALSVLREITQGSGRIHLPDTQEYVEWVNPDYHDTILPKLHAGHFSVQAFLDLHGFTVPEAEEELELFISDAFQKGWSCIKIIHGRGLRSVKGARLKDMVIKRLSGHFRRETIAYTTARQCDGGLGALYVLLKRK
jgi:DNA-nicking Smr family endonuclease